MIIRALIAVLLLTSACALAPAPAHYYPESVFPDFGKPWGEDRIPAIPELTRHDQMMSLHALAMALTVQQGESRYLWANPETTNSGEVTILGIIPNGPYAGCLGLQRAVLIQGRDTYREYPAACRGGGNSNTWIINRKWVICDGLQMFCTRIIMIMNKPSCATARSAGDNIVNFIALRRNP